MYIAYNINTKRVVGEPSEKPFATFTNNVAIAECDNIPQNYDYLLVDNVRQATKVVQEAYTEEVIEFNEETQQEETKLVEHAQVTETYYACDLIPKFYEYTAKQLEAQRHAQYTSECIREIGKEISIQDELKLMRRLLASIDPAVFTDAKSRMNFLDYNLKVEETILNVTKKYNK